MKTQYIINQIERSPVGFLGNQLRNFGQYSHIKDILLNHEYLIAPHKTYHRYIAEYCIKSLVGESFDHLAHFDEIHHIIHSLCDPRDSGVKHNTLELSKKLTEDNISCLFLDEINFRLFEICQYLKVYNNKMYNYLIYSANI